MPRITIVNLKAGTFSVQDPSGLDGFSMDVAPNDTESADLSDIAFAAIEQDLKDAAASLMITWTVEDDPDVLADSIRPINDVYGEDLGEPEVEDPNYFLISVNMQVGEYTLDETELPADNPPRSVIVTHTQVGGVDDTFDQAVLVGTDVNNEAITESLTIASGSTVVSTKAFKTLTSFTTPGWVVDTTEDTIEVGFDTLLGLSYLLGDAAEVFMTFLDGVARKPDSITVDAAVASKNTVSLTGGTYDGAKQARALFRRLA